MPELRKEIISGAWVIIATERGKRPSDFTAQAEPKKGGVCPFCTGNENLTPPEVFALRKQGTVPDSPGWQVRVIPNKFAALAPEGQLEKQEQLPWPKMTGVGVHEVIVETPSHEEGFPAYGTHQAQRVVKVWQQRFQHLRSESRLQYCQIFKNYRSAAGASLEHPHSQLIATPLVPRVIVDEMAGAGAFHQEEGTCVYCYLLTSEAKDGSRVIFENQNFVAYCPFASRFAMEIWIVPKHHQSDFGLVSEQKLDSLAEALLESTGRLAAVAGDPPYNLILHTAPYHQQDPHYHWHIEILPRLTIQAGFEWGSGIFINPTVPEEAAKFMREATLTSQRS